MNNSGYGIERYYQKDIVRKIFRNYSSISFIVVITPEEVYNPLSAQTKKSYKINAYANADAKHHIGEDFINSILHFKNHIPLFQNMPINAKHQLNNPFKSNSFYGEYAMSKGDTTIKISSRMLTELLSGILSFDKFNSDQIAASGVHKNEISQFFLRKIQNGQMIKTIQVKNSEDEDDDWIEINYGDSDAAISAFN